MKQRGPKRPLSFEELKNKIAQVYFEKTAGCVGNVDDCTGFVLESRITRPKQNLGYAVVDYIRQETGVRHGAEIYNPKHSLYFTDVFTDELYVERVDLRAHEGRLNLEELDARSRAYFLLYTKWGFTKKEIAELFGVTEARISQRMKVICLILQRSCAEHS